MANDNVFKLFLDNATIAGAGRALYDQYVDRSDGLALSHLECKRGVASSFLTQSKLE